MRAIDLKSYEVIEMGDGKYLVVGESQTGDKVEFSVQWESIADGNPVILQGTIHATDSTLTINIVPTTRSGFEWNADFNDANSNDPPIYMGGGTCKTVEEARDAAMNQICQNALFILRNNRQKACPHPADKVMAISEKSLGSSLAILGMFASSDNWLTCTACGAKFSGPQALAIAYTRLSERIAVLEGKTK